MLKPIQVYVGTDPEGFGSRDGVIIGSEKFIPKSGLKAIGLRYGNPIVVLDGVQFELNPYADVDIPGLGRNISTAFQALSKQLNRAGDVKLDWRTLIEVSREELDSLSDDTRILGCHPSKNVYGDKPIMVDAKTYRKRSAGGHLHFGLSERLKTVRTDFISNFDIFVGNLSVLLDRDMGAIERRQNYGRAGEYREPRYGVEYRTPSNYWLRNYSLLDFVHGMGNLAISVVADKFENKKSKVEDELINLVNIDKVIAAIDTNNFELALSNLDDIRPFLAKHLPERGFPLTPGTIDKFIVFAKGVEANGLAAFFPTDPLESWVNGEQVAFSDFLKTVY